MPSVPKPERTPSQRGKAAKRKGYRTERAVAARLGGERVPLSGSLGGRLSGDVTDRHGMTAEVKSRRTGFALLYRWLEIDPNHGVDHIVYSKAVQDGRKQAPDYLVLRADNSPELVVMTVATMLAMWDRAERGRE